MQEEIKSVNFSEVPVKLVQPKTNVDITKYTPAEIESFKQISSSINENDQNSILNFGLELQSRMSRYSDDFLNNIKSFDAGEIGGSINTLLNEIDYIDIDPSDQPLYKRALLAIPGIKNLIFSTKKILNKYESVSKNIDGITTKLDKGRLTIVKDNNRLQNLFDNNLELIESLEQHIIAGHIKLDELKHELVHMESNRSDFEEYQIQDKQEFISRLSKRVHDMELTRIITVQSLPQIRLVQNNNNTMLEKIQSSITTTIPIWKNQISIAVALNRQKNILEVQNKIYETTNTILKKNSELLKNNSADVARQNERGVVSLETIKQVNSDLISTLSEIKKIKEEGELQRVKIASELQNVEKELKETIIKDQF
jgi:uncharacterized protein YaaN involved in tellurite resistance